MRHSTGPLSNFIPIGYPYDLSATPAWARAAGLLYRWTDRRIARRQ